MQAITGFFKNSQSNALVDDAMKTCKEHYKQLDQEHVKAIDDLLKKVPAIIKMLKKYEGQANSVVHRANSAVQNEKTIDGKIEVATQLMLDVAAFIRNTENLQRVEQWVNDNGQTLNDPITIEAICGYVRCVIVGLPEHYKSAIAAGLEVVTAAFEFFDEAPKTARFLNKMKNTLNEKCKGVANAANQAVEQGQRANAVSQHTQAAKIGGSGRSSTSSGSRSGSSASRPTVSKKRQQQQQQQQQRQRTSRGGTRASSTSRQSADGRQGRGQGGQGRRRTGNGRSYSSAR